MTAFYQAYYAFSDPNKQIESYIDNSIRAEASKSTLEEMNKSKDLFCKKIKEDLSEKLKSKGFQVEDTLITSILPSNEILKAMDKLNVSKLNLEASRNESEANKVRLISEAEADKERKKLQGEGIAEQRKAIISGFKSSVDEFSKSLGITPSDALSLTLSTQYLDTLKEIGSSPNAKVIIVPQSATGSTGLLNEIRNSLVQIQEVK